MNSFKSYWSALWDNFHKEWYDQTPADSSDNDEEEIEEYNVGVVHVLIHYLDENNKLNKKLACLIGELDEDEEIIPASEQLDRWLKEAVIYGVYTIENRLLIPRERVVKMVTTYENFWISFEEEDE